MTQDELLDALWPDPLVQPGVLKSHVKDIRGALGDDPKHFLALSRMTDDSDKRSLDVDSPASKLVGRNTELDQLRTSLRRTLHGERQLVFVTGEPGIGKTALVDEFQRQAAADSSGLHIARGQCVEGYGAKNVGLRIR